MNSKNSRYKNLEFEEGIYDSDEKQLRTVRKFDKNIQTVISISSAFQILEKEDNVVCSFYRDGGSCEVNTNKCKIVFPYNSSTKKHKMYAGYIYYNDSTNESYLAHLKFEREYY